MLFGRLRRRLNRTRIRALARALSQQVAGGRPFTCLVTGDAELRRLNRQFLGRDYPTDVLAFPGPVAQASGAVKKRSARPLAGARGSVGGANAVAEPRPGTLRVGSGPGDGFTAPSACGSLGDLAISTGRAAAQARRLGHSLEDEIGVLMLHGVLHLMGYDHEDDRGRMRRAEARWRRALGLPAGLAERDRS